MSELPLTDPDAIKGLSPHVRELIEPRADSLRDQVNECPDPMQIAMTLVLCEQWLETRRSRLASLVNFA